MNKVTTIAVDLAKDVFQVGFFDERGDAVEPQRRIPSRQGFERFLKQLEPPLTVLFEVGLGAQAWARVAQARGLRVRLLPAQRVAEHRTGSKNDRKDVAAIARAGRDRDIHAVPIKTTEQLSLQALHRIREGWVRRRTVIANQVRGLLTDHGIAFAKGDRAFNEATQRVMSDARVAISPMLRDLIAESYAEWSSLGERRARLDAELKRIAATDPIARRLDAIRGIGPITATALACKAIELERFANARCFAASFGLIPEQDSSGSRIRLGQMTRRGDRYIRSLLVSGAQAVIRHLPRRTDNGKLTNRLRRWVERRGAKAAAIRLANHNLRVAYVLLTRNQEYSA
jgi:transposase